MRSLSLLFYRYYEGAQPTIVVSDVDMIREIYIKKFHIFANRKVG